MAGGLAQRQGPQDPLAETGVGLRAGPLGLRLRRAHLADLLGAGGGLQPGPVGQAGGVDQGGGGALLGLPAPVGPLLGDERLAPSGHLELGGELVDGDLLLALDGEGAPLVEGAVGLGLELLAQRGLEGLLNVRLGAQGQDAHVADLDAHAGQPLLAPHPVHEGVAHQGQAGGQGLGQIESAQDVDDEGLGDLADEVGDLPHALDALGVVGHGVDGEVEAAGGGLGVGEAVGEHGLNGDVLLVAGGDVEEDGALVVGGGHLGDRGEGGPEPEGEADAAVGRRPAAQVHDVLGGGALVAGEEEQAADASHGGLLRRCGERRLAVRGLSARVIGKRRLPAGAGTAAPRFRQNDDIWARHFSSR